jgi:hypothetical protein
VPLARPSEITSYHQALVSQIQTQRRDNHIHNEVLMIGSNRQSIHLDCINAMNNDNNLAPLVAKAFANDMNMHFDPFLMSDLNAHQKAGFNISKLIRLLHQQGFKHLNALVPHDILASVSQQAHDRFCYSQDKINIIYAQIHRVAQYARQVDFHFYDDLYHDVLCPLASFFKRFPSLIPSNVNMNLYEYDRKLEKNSAIKFTDDGPVLMTRIQGTGHIDVDYPKTVATMEDIAIETCGHKNEYLMSDFIEPHLLDQHKLTLK